jgi:hypothetical protein
MLQGRNPATMIYAENTPDSAMPIRKGQEVAIELGGRLLIRYLRQRDVASKPAGSSAVLGARTDATWVTPTPLSPTEAVAALALPFALEPRTHAVLLNPARIAHIQGPRRILHGTGIEYLLPQGYPAAALTLPWEL